LYGLPGLLSIYHLPPLSFNLQVLGEARVDETFLARAAIVLTVPFMAWNLMGSRSSLKRGFTMRSVSVLRCPSTCQDSESAGLPAQYLTVVYIIKRVGNVLILVITIVRTF
jgi:hypothetical protein